MSDGPSGVAGPDYAGLPAGPTGEVDWGRHPFLKREVGTALRLRM
jgi:hypothetical protein